MRVPSRWFYKEENIAMHASWELLLSIQKFVDYFYFWTLMFEHRLGREIAVWGGNPALRIWNTGFNKVQILNYFSVVTVTCLNVNNDTSEMHTYILSTIVYCSHCCYLNCFKEMQKFPRTVHLLRRRIPLYLCSSSSQCLNDTKYSKDKLWFLNSWQ